MVAADRDDGRVGDRALLVDGDLGRAAADVHEADAELLLVRRQDGLGRGELLEDELHDLDARLVHAGHDVLGDRHGRRHDVDVRLEPAADHADRVGHAVLAVHREVPGHDVDDLVVLGDLHAPGGVDDPGDVLLGDLPVLAGHGDDPPAVEGPDVRARDPDPGAGDLDARP